MLTKNIISILSFIILFTSNTFAQSIVTGRITNSEGRTLSDVFVLVKGTKSSSYTDSLGNFSIIVPKGSDELMFVKSGFVERIVKVESSNIDVQLMELDAIYKMNLEELLNIEVYSVSKSNEKIRESAASVRVISRNEIEQCGYTDLIEVFQDIAGVDIAPVELRL